MPKDALTKARAIAYYLPQYYPITENDEWWGKGFTEWTNVTRVKPLFRGHVQPRLPGELGFYDLRIPEVREQQADLAREHGIEAFCYWHYWLGGGKRMLDYPFEEVLQNGRPDFKFCLAWANHDWKGNFFGASKRMLLEQKYGGETDFLEHFNFLERAFSDERYLKVDGKPLFMVYLPNAVPDCHRYLDFWRSLAESRGFKGLHLVACDIALSDAISLGFDAASSSRHRLIDNQRRLAFLKSMLVRGRVRGAFDALSRFIQPNGLKRYSYRDAMLYFLKGEYAPDDYPSVVPNWDTTARYERDAVILYQDTPELFRTHVREAIQKIEDNRKEHRLLFIKSWNEWAEGNYLEPDRQYGRQKLEVFREEIYN